MHAIWIRLERLTDEPARRYDIKHLELLSLSQSPSALSSFPSTTTTTTTVSSNGGGSTATDYFPAAPLHPRYEGQPVPDEHWTLPSSDDEERIGPDPRVAAPTLPRATYDDVDPNHPFPFDPQ